MAEINVTPDPQSPDEAPLALPRLLRVPGGEPDMHASLTEAVAQAMELAGTLKQPPSDFPVRLRLNPTLYLYATQNYTGWRGVNWVLELSQADAAALVNELDAWIREWVNVRMERVQD